MNSGISFGPVEADPATSASTTIDAKNLDEAFRKGLHLLLSRLFNLARRRAALPCSTKNPHSTRRHFLATKMRPVEDPMEKSVLRLAERKSQRDTALFRCTYGRYPSGLESNNPESIASGPSRCYSKGRSGSCPKRKSKSARTRGAIARQRRAVSIVAPTAKGRLTTRPSRATVGI
jgi:hypothetical protein